MLQDMSTTDNGSRGPLDFSSSPPRPSPLSPSRRNGSPKTPPTIQTSHAHPTRRQSLNDHTLVTDSPARRKTSSKLSPQRPRSEKPIRPSTSPRVVPLASPRPIRAPFQPLGQIVEQAPTPGPNPAKVRSQRIDSPVRASCIPKLDTESQTVRSNLNSIRETSPPANQIPVASTSRPNPMGPPPTLPSRRSSMRAASKPKRDSPPNAIDQENRTSVSPGTPHPKRKPPVNAAGKFSKLIQAFSHPSKPNDKTKTAPSTKDATLTFPAPQSPEVVAAVATSPTKRKSRHNSVASENGPTPPEARLKTEHDTSGASDLSESVQIVKSDVQGCPISIGKGLGPAFEDTSETKPGTKPVTKAQVQQASQSSKPSVEVDKKRRSRRSALVSPPWHHSQTPSPKGRREEQLENKGKWSHTVLLSGGLVADLEIPLDNVLEVPSSPASSVPSIVVTPPPMVSLASPFSFKLSSKAIFSLSCDISADPAIKTSVEMAGLHIGANQDDQKGTKTPSGPPIESDTLSEHAFEQMLLQRGREDDLALAGLFSEIDWTLSDFLNFKHPNEAWRLSSNLVDLLQASLEPEGVTGSYCLTFHARESASPVRAPPTIRREPLVLPKFLQEAKNQAWWSERKHQAEVTLRHSQLDKTFEHIVSGISCLLSE